MNVIFFVELSTVAKHSPYVKKGKRAYKIKNDVVITGKDDCPKFGYSVKEHKGLKEV